MIDAPVLPAGISFFQRGWLSSNNVLLQDDEQAVLIDSGYWTHAQQTTDLVVHALRGAPLTRLLNTHLHSDHCGGNAQLQLVYPQLQTLVPPGHAGFVFDWDPAALTYTPTGQHCPQFIANDVVQPGDRFAVSNREWVALAAPGHDPNSIILFCDELGILISADALWENGFGVVFPEIEGIEAFDEVSETLHVIESLNAKLVLPGHGGMFTDVHLALENARSRLSSFRKDPVKHANYAAKVMLKFKLLELQRISLADFLLWAEGCDYLRLLQTRYAPSLAFGDWALSMCDALEKSGAVRRDGQVLINV
jgi:glyoxylase-like metal-dependent hydrolase (beta-lactamase superfamily II)